MEKTEYRMEKTIHTTEIICDCCGKSCKKDTYTDNDGVEEHVFEYLKMSAHWGYYSNDKDCMKYTAHICEPCVDERLGFINFDKVIYNPLTGK